MRPLIGITTSMEAEEDRSFVGKDNVQAIVLAGGTPLLLPNLTDDERIKQYAELLDGLYVTGGYDIDPTLFGEEPHPELGIITPTRDRFETALIRELLKKDKPILAVCRGCQILNIAAGGDMYQDIYSQIDGELLQHSQHAPKGHGSHYVLVESDSLLQRITGEARLRVNSRHHQANRRIPSGFMVSGTASDGVIEAIESQEHAFVLGLQWHPENMAAAGDEASKKIYQVFIDACNQQRRSG
ncbi:putative glutamine amidotransferase [Melghiribacillus thermohalophilus]|uniref:Putative glutamine amidotransferase n=1 Tax=Melghiribacillus thermohalophilus TaxID=1324956 RepID=A0A4R3NAJ7_9BACI|nr:gamma-glutamyl-gamma-aminobutyrate hydrolase family protein [Melghiribacillus thermohalophilus]TCT26504.1 putative glutamine amidotransferase [Melghiribacillus thermohalophilus]